MSHGIFRGTRRAPSRGVRHGGASTFDVANLHISVIGDSNAAGVVTISPNVAEFGVNAVDYRESYAGYYALASNDPPSFVDMGIGALRPHTDPGVTNGAFDLMCGQGLITAGIKAFESKFAISGIRLVDWLPASTYMLATTGTNLYNTWKNRTKSHESNCSRKLDLVIVNLGTNDAANNPDANAFAANMGTFNTQVHADFPNAKIVWVGTHSATGNTFTSTVITQQNTYASTAPAYFALIKINDTTLVGDLLHYSQLAAITVGDRAIIAGLDLLGFARRTVTVSPDVVSWGPASFGSGALAPLAPADIRNGDLLLMYVGSGITSVAITTPATWTLVASASSTASGVTEQYAIFSKAVTTVELNANNGTIAQTSVADISDENVAQIFCIRGPNLNPTVDVSNAFVSNIFGQGPITPTGVTTTSANDTVFVFAGGFSGGIGGGMSVTNAGLTNVAKFKEGSYQLPDTGFQLVTLTRGQKVAAGATGVSSVTSLTNMVMGVVTVAVKP